MALNQLVKIEAPFTGLHGLGSAAERAVLPVLVKNQAAS